MPSILQVWRLSTQAMCTTTRDTGLVCVFTVGTSRMTCAPAFPSTRASPRGARSRSRTCRRWCPRSVSSSPPREQESAARTVVSAAHPRHCTVTVAMHYSYKYKYKECAQVIRLLQHSEQTQISAGSGRRETVVSTPGTGVIAIRVALAAQGHHVLAPASSQTPCTRVLSSA